ERCIAGDSALAKDFQRGSHAIRRLGGSGARDITGKVALIPPPPFSARSSEPRTKSRSDLRRQCRCSTPYDREVPAPLPLPCARAQCATASRFLPHGLRSWSDSNR